MKTQLVMGMLVMGMLVMGMAAAAHARWYSQWSFHCSFKANSSEVESVRFDVWDASYKNRPLANHPATWNITATKEELTGMNLTVLSESTGFFGLNRPCKVVSNKTGERLSFSEAWTVFGDIQRKHQAAAEEREAARRDAIRKSLAASPN